MKTKVFLWMFLCGLLLPAAAQEYSPQVGSSKDVGYKTYFKHNKSSDNWFVSIAGGASTFFGDETVNADFSDRLNFAPQVSFGKWFNPYIAFRLQLNGGSIHSFSGPQGEFMQHNKYMGAHANLLLDVTNLWAPYNDRKVFRLIPWVGMGYAQRFETQGIPRSESPTLNSGILTAFRLSNFLDLNVEIQGSLLNEAFNRQTMKKLSDGIVQATVGLTFKLGRNNFEVLEPADYNLLNDLNSRINSLRSENDQLSKRPVSCPECPENITTNVVTKKIDNVVHFRLNSAVIDKNQQIAIFNTSEFMKKDNTPIKVIGYADKNTGTSSYNSKLSEMRARAVAKVLTDKYGIPSNQITIEWKGSSEQPYEENNWNRVVIMRAND
jgi:outer membrane protein OmpA-like peptidoglycan-associated protein